MRGDPHRVAIGEEIPWSEFEAGDDVSIYFRDLNGEALWSFLANPNGERPIAIGLQWAD